MWTSLASVQVVVAVVVAVAVEVVGAFASTFKRESAQEVTLADFRTPQKDLAAAAAAEAVATEAVEVVAAAAGEEAGEVTETVGVGVATTEGVATVVVGATMARRWTWWPRPRQQASSRSRS